MAKRYHANGSMGAHSKKHSVVHDSHEAQYEGRHHSDGRHMAEHHGHDGHHSSKKPHHSHAGHARVRPDTEHYSGMDSRRREEMRDAGMIHEDHKAIANMPQGVIMREYPKSRDYLDWQSDDTERGIDSQIDLDHNRMHHSFNPKKF